MTFLDDNRLFDAEPKARGIAQALYAGIKDLPLVSPHGHTEPRWYAENETFPDPARLLIVPDHYVFRMLFSQGIRLEDLGVPTTDGAPVETDGRTIWRLFAKHYYLFRGTPTRMWLDHTFATLFGITERLSEKNADALYDQIAELLQRDEFRPRALFERFNLEVISTTDAALDDLKWHRMIRDSGWKGRVVPAYRPNSVVDPDLPASPTISTRWATSPARIPATGRAISPHTASAGPISNSSAPLRRTTATRRRRRRTCRPRTREPCSTRSAPAMPMRTNAACSGLRCSPRWPR